MVDIPQDIRREDSTTQTHPQSAREELLDDSFPPSRSPLYPLTFSSTQTSIPLSPRRATSTAAVSEAAADEMVARVLLEHTGAGSEESEENEESSPQSC